MNVMTAAAAGGGALLLALLVFKADKPSVEEERLAPFVVDCRERLTQIGRMAMDRAKARGESVPIYIRLLMGSKINSMCQCVHDELAGDFDGTELKFGLELHAIKFRAQFARMDKDREVRKAQRVAQAQEVLRLLERQGLSRSEVRRITRKTGGAFAACHRGKKRR